MFNLLLNYVLQKHLFIFFVVLNMTTLSNIKYSISELSKLSGIKQHTIRIWEQRYGILIPERTDTKIRFYSDKELKLIMNIALLNKKGLKISKIAMLSEQELLTKVNEVEIVQYNHDIVIDQLTKSMISFDEPVFEKIINSAILNFGFQSVMLEVVYPFLEKIGLLWQTGHINPAQEHFISNLIRQKIIVAIDGQVVSYKANTKKVMLFLPQHELHEIAILFYSYILKLNHHHVIYLGANLPNIHVQEVINVYEPDFVFTVLTSSLNLKNTRQLFLQSSTNNPSIKFMIGGCQAYNLEDIGLSNINILHSLQEELDFCVNIEP